MFFPRCCLHVLLSTACGVAAWSMAALPAWAQDQLVFRDNHVQAGKVVGMKDGAVLLTVTAANGAPGQISFNLALLSRVDAAPPPSYAPAVAAYESGQWDKALAALQPLAEQFRGLPTSWAQQAAAALGDLYLEKKDLTRAEAAYNDYRRLYPATAGNTLRFELGQARIAFARDHLAAARIALESITSVALKNPAEVSRADAAAYGQAFYVLGEIQERGGNFQEALADYLRTTTLFYQDPATTGRAQKEADKLRAAHKDLAAP